MGARQIGGLHFTFLMYFSGMKRILTLSFLLLAGLLMAQEYAVKVKVKGAENKRIMFAAFDDLDYHVIDTARADDQGQVEFSLPAITEKGMYRIYTAKDEYFDLVFGREDIEVEIDYNDAEEGMNIIQSEENQAWYDYLEVEYDVMNRLDLLSPVVSYYPEGSFRDSAIAEFRGLQMKLSGTLREICDRDPNSLACHMAAVRKPPLMDADIAPEDRVKWLQDHYFDGINMNDTMLLNTTVYADKVIDYIGIYSDRSLTQSQLEDRFITAIDKIMTYVQPELGVYSYIVQYLVNGFERYKFEKVLNHIAENYMTEFSCEDADQQKAIEKRLESFRRMAIGKRIPAFSIPDLNGEAISLEKLEAPYHLLVFWSSECPHCIQMLPELAKMYKGDIKGKMDILAVSLDKERSKWVEVIEGKDYPWVHVSELKGWGSSIANDFHIYATPTMILTDANGTILAKPITLPELRTELREKGLLN